MSHQNDGIFNRHGLDEQEEVVMKNQQKVRQEGKGEEGRQM